MSFPSINSSHPGNISKSYQNLFRLIFEIQINFQIDIRYLYQIIAHSNLLFNNDSYQKSLPALKDLYYGLKIKFISDVTFPTWAGKIIKPNFRQYQSYRNNDKFNCYLEIQSEFERGPVNAALPTFPNINLTKTIKNLPVVSNITELSLQ